MRKLGGRAGPRTEASKQGEQKQALIHVTALWALQGPGKMAHYPRNQSSLGLKQGVPEPPRPPIRI